MLLSRMVPDFCEKKKEWIMRMRIIQNAKSYHADYYYHDGIWSEPKLYCSSNGNLLEEGEEKRELMESLLEQKETIERWQEEEKPVFQEICRFSDCGKLAGFESKTENIDFAVFENTAVKIGIYMAEGEKPFFTFEGNGFNKLINGCILENYPNIYRQIKENHPKRLRFLF